MKTAVKHPARTAKAASPAENVTNDAIRVITEAMLGAGESHAQGDLYFVRLPAMPASARPRASRQLAEGETQGSRHVCTVGDAFDADPAELAAAVAKASGCTVDARYVGPVVRTSEGRAIVEHPEHGDHDYRGDMVLAVVFQRALDAEERESRVQD